MHLLDLFDIFGFYKCIDRGCSCPDRKSNFVCVALKDDACTFANRLLRWSEIFNSMLFFPLAVFWDTIQNNIFV